MLKFIVGAALVLVCSGTLSAGECPETDNNSMCGRGYFSLEDCEKYINLPEECPYMCGVCGNCEGVACQNGGILDPSTCTCRCSSMFTGSLCEERICPDTDNSVECGEQLFIPEYCPKSYRVREECPYMCGVCGNCEGTVCHNGGTLDPSTCTCMCSDLYRGTYCEESNCVDEDQPYCQYLSSYHCDVIDNIPEECPVMCETCTNLMPK